MNHEHIQAALTWALTFTGLLLVAALIGLAGALFKTVCHLFDINL
jgi:uncharacterized membrane protein